MNDYTTRYLEIEQDRPAPDSQLADLAAMCERVGLKPPREGLTVAEAQEFRRAIHSRIARGGRRK